MGGWRRLVGSQSTSPCLTRPSPHSSLSVTQHVIKKTCLPPVNSIIAYLLLTFPKIWDQYSIFFKVLISFFGAVMRSMTCLTFRSEGNICINIFKLGMARSDTQIWYQTDIGLNLRIEHRSNLYICKMYKYMKYIYIKYINVSIHFWSISKF